MNLRFLPMLAVGSLLPAAAQAQTDFTDADATDSLITNSLNWDNGLPTGQQGTLAINASYDSSTIGGTGPDKNDPVFPIDGYDILHTAGTVSRAGGIASLRIGGGTSYVMHGATAAFGSTRGISVVGSGTSFVLNDGDADLTDNSRDSSVSDGGTITINGGTMSVGRHLYLQSGDITVNGGALAVSADLGARNFHTGGILSLNGGTITALYLTFGKGTFDLNFGGSTPGTFTVENFGGGRANVNLIDIDFDPGSQMSMQLTVPVEQGASGDGDLGWTDAADPATGLEWAQALWETGRLSYNDDTVSGIDILGEGGTTVLTWEQAQVDLGDGAAFVFDSPTDTLSLTTGGAPPTPLEIIGFEAVDGSPGVWQVSIAGAVGADYVFRSASDLDFSSGSVVENLTAGVPAAGTIGGTNDSVVTTDGSGQATVRMTLVGDPADFIRAEDAP